MRIFLGVATAAVMTGQMLATAGPAAAAATQQVQCETELGSQVDLALGERIEFKISRGDSGMYGPTRILVELGVLTDASLGLSELAFSVDAGACSHGVVDPAVVACTGARPADVWLRGTADGGAYSGRVSVRPTFSIRRVLVPEAPLEHFELDWSFAVDDHSLSLNQVVLTSCVATHR